MSTAKLLLSLCLGLLPSAALVGGARAQIPAPYLEYGAKFTCGSESANEADDVVTGVYATSINIHNPQAKAAVSFIKKIVIADREGTTFGRILVLKGALAPDEADRVDCIFIYRSLGVALGVYVEGFVVLEVPPITSVGGATFQPVLDVVGKYTARGAVAGATVSSESVVPYTGKPITN